MASSLGHCHTGVAHDGESSGKGRCPGTTSQNEPLDPPTLLPSQVSRAVFQIRHGDRGKRDVINLSIQFPFKNGPQGNNVVLFFKHF